MLSETERQRNKRPPMLSETEDDPPMSSPEDGSESLSFIMGIERGSHVYDLPLREKYERHHVMFSHRPIFNINNFMLLVPFSIQ
jgi:hypothetical protein